MDRRWNGADYERDSNSSEKKLLPVSATLSIIPSSVKDNNNTASTAGGGEENEYAYIDRKSLSTFSGIHTLSNGIEQQQQHQQISPEPYATTDILRSSASVATNVAVLSNDQNVSLRNGGSQTQLYAVRFHLYSVSFCDKNKFKPLQNLMLGKYFRNTTKFVIFKCKGRNGKWQKLGMQVCRM